MSGSRGPVPKRSTQKHGHRTKAELGQVERLEVVGLVEPPAARDGWHPVARDWFEALKASAQSRWYEPSDWATAMVIAESMSREFSPRPKVTPTGIVVEVTEPPTGAAMSAWLRAMSSLLVTEGDRRRMRIELERVAGVDPEEEAADARVVDILSRVTG